MDFLFHTPLPQIFYSQQVADLSASPSLTCSFLWSLTWGLGGLGLVPQFREGPQCSRHLTLAEIWVVVAEPCPGWESRRAGLLGSKDWGEIALGDRKGSILSCITTFVLPGYARQTREPVIKLDRTGWCNAKFLEGQEVI